MGENAQLAAIVFITGSNNVVLPTLFMILFNMVFLSQLAMLNYEQFCRAREAQHCSSILDCRVTVFGRVYRTGLLIFTKTYSG